MYKLETIGSKIKELRRNRHLSQEELADIINVNFRTIQRIETGRNVPSLETLSKLAQAFEINIRDFFNFEYLKDRKEIIGSVNEILNKMDDEKLRTFYRAVYCFYN